MGFILFMLLLTIFTVYIGKIIFFRENIFIKIIAIILINMGLLLYVLFKHYIVKEFWLMGSFFLIVLFIISILFNTFFIKQCYKKIKLLLLFIPIICIIFDINNIGNKIGMALELSKAKNKLDNIITNAVEYDNVHKDGNMYAFVYISGVVDNWVAFVYDDTGLLDYGIKIIEENKNYMNKKEYEKIKMLFGGDIYSILKLENNWYLCSFT
jgi:hypothetical protein